MTGAVYNEVEPFAIRWLRNLRAAGHIADGRVDERSIEDLVPEDLAGAQQFHAFAGVGVWSYALRLAGVPDDAPVWTGSCPCQPFSVAGKRRGTADRRHLWPAWFALIRECLPPVVFGEQVASPAGRDWLDAVSADLEGVGYAVGSADLCAAGVGAPHIRQRLYFVAHALPAGRAEGWAGAGDGSAPRGGRARLLADTTDRERRDGPSEAGGQPEGEAGGHGVLGIVGHSGGEGGGRHSGSVPRPEAQGKGEGRSARGVANEPESPGATRGFWHPADWLPCYDGPARPVEPGTFPLAHGAPARVGRDGSTQKTSRVGMLKAYGNAIVPQVAAVFIRSAMEVISASDS